MFLSRTRSFWYVVFFIFPWLPDSRAYYRAVVLAFGNSFTVKTGRVLLFENSMFEIFMVTMSTKAFLTT